MNDKNLIPLNKRTKSEQREIAKKGGKASAKVRAEKRTTRELVEAYDRRLLSDEENAQLFNIGIERDDRTAKMLRTLALIRQAEKGDVTANKLLLEVTGEIGKNAILLDEEEPEEITIRIVDASGEEPIE